MALNGILIVRFVPRTSSTIARDKKDLFYTVYALEKSPDVIAISVMDTDGFLQYPDDWRIGCISKWSREITDRVAARDESLYSSNVLKGM